MRVRFGGGRVVEVLTDGRERKSPVNSAKGEAEFLAEHVVRADWKRHRGRYFSPDKSPAEVAAEWDGKRP